MTRHAFLDRLDRAEFAPAAGRVRRVSAARIEASGPAARLGDLCLIERDGGPAQRWLAAEVVDVALSGVSLVPLEDAPVRVGARVEARPEQSRVAVGDAFAGCAVDALGRFIEGRSPIVSPVTGDIVGHVPPPLDRRDPSRVLVTGIRAIDSLLTLGVGQRIGIFAASGVGKTSLIEQIAFQTAADRCILCLVGERGREVETLWRQVRGRKDAKRFTLVAATSDESAALRARAVNYALALAEFWRSQGEHVLLIVDSMTRVAMALREIGLAAGAPPTVRAYTPNVFAALPRIVERCGAVTAGGAITAVMTVLSETDDVDDPIVEVMKSLLDGHIVLSRTLAEQGQFPAIDVPRSVSRQSSRLVAPPHASAMRQAAAMLAAYEDARVMIESGVYAKGSNPVIDHAIESRGALDAFLRQSQSQSIALDISVAALSQVTVGGPAHG